MRSTDLGLTWRQRGSVPWQPEFGRYVDGPGEPDTARLPGGGLCCVFRSDAGGCYWAAHSDDDGATWSPPAKLAAWSVKPRLRIMSSGLLVLAGGRSGVHLWGSADGGRTWVHWSLAAEHNRFAGPGLALGANYSFSPVVANASGPAAPHLHAAQTPAYTGLAETADGALVVSYDRLANGWLGPPGAWGDCDTLFSMRVHFVL